MRTPQYSVDRLHDAFLSRPTLTMPEMMEALGTDARMTVFRKLRGLDYRASYSHAGKYYTLDDSARWDPDGLWTYHGIHFSRHGTLLATLQHLIDISPAGHFAEELEQRVGVRVHNTLAALHKRGSVARQQIRAAFLYGSATGGERQFLRRRRAEEERVSEAHRGQGVESPEVTEGLRVFLATLNEKQRRLYAGFESLKLGRGGDTRIAQITGLNAKTVARGRKDLLAGDIHPDRIRSPGAGRPSVKKNRGSPAAGAAAGG